MLVSRTTVRQLRSGEEVADPMSGMPDGDREAMLRSLMGKDALPLSGGLPVGEERKVNGKSSPLSVQARTGRSSLLGDR